MGHIHKHMTFVSLEQSLCHLTYSPHHSNLLISDLPVILQGDECRKVKYIPFDPVQL